MQDVKFRIRLKAVGKGTGYEVGETVVLYNEIFNKQNGIAFFQLNLDWQVLSTDQFTAKQDKKGTDIYVGDILTNGKAEIRMIVVFDETRASFMMYFHDNDNPEFYMALTSLNHLSVIGNITDNPELIN